MSRAVPLRLTAGLVLLPIAAVLSAECGGNDVIDSSDAMFEGATFDAVSDAGLADGPRDTSSGDSTTPDTGSADAEAGLRDADGGLFDAGDTAGVDAGDADAGDGGANDADAGDANAGDADASNADAGDADAGVEGGTVAPTLGTASTFALLASATITNTGGTTVFGDVGISPGTALVGLTAGQVTGSIHLGDAVAAQAESDMGFAYNNLAGRQCQHTMTGVDLGGKTLPPGVYCFGVEAAQMVGNLTLDGQGDPNAVWIFQISSTLTISASLSTNMINSGNACNVYWQVGSSATINTSAQFKGNVLAKASVTLLTGARVSPGRVFAQMAAVTLDTNAISNAGCP
jgi:hypothetical protein